MTDEAFWLRVLGRERIAYAAESARPLIEGEVVLVTGAGGTIGSALVAACLALGARQVLALDWSENLLFTLDERFKGKPVRTFLGSVQDPLLLDRVMLIEPSVVFHAAAVKHVARAEREPAIAARVNVGGTFAIAACDAPCVRRAVLVSTDKAAAPTTIMGMTKRVAEGVWTAFGARGVAVRPVNVIGSSGSVGETFLARQRASLPIEASPASRMFATAEETAAMILEAAAADNGTACVAYPGPAPPAMTMQQLAARIAFEEAIDTPAIGSRSLFASEKVDEVLIGCDEGFPIRLTDRLMAVANLGDMALAGEARRVAETGSDRAVRELLRGTFGRRAAA
jgi:FlaA1/EpsC-like NDP-sugar epimerase